MRSTFSSGISLLIAGALALSIGWGIRGNFGHEFGATIPGALAAMAVVILSGREDWLRRIGFFGFFGALGWSFGGSISYMQVIGYTHSGHSLSVLYGFACLFVIGFLWGAMGGAGTAIPAILDRNKLTEFFPPLLAVFFLWTLQTFFESWIVSVNPDFRQESPLYWYDTDWLAALTAIAAVLLLAAVRRRWDQASGLILWMAVGWWIGFILFVLVLGWRMTPPRGDNWAGCSGMVVALLIYFWRQKQLPIVLATLISGFVGGFGFVTATLLKLVEVKSGWQTNWHSVLEQTYGAINGVGVALALAVLIKAAPEVIDQPRVRRWTDDFSILFVLLGITYLNLQKNPEVWTRTKVMPDPLWIFPPSIWFAMAYGGLLILMLALLRQHRRQPLSWIPVTALGKAQLLLLVFLWWMVIGNFERALVSFAPQRLITEGVIFLNALLLSWIILRQPTVVPESPKAAAPDFRLLTRKAVVAGLILTLISVMADWAVIRAIYGDQFAGHAGKHIRFGPNATATKEKPKPGQAHP